MTQNDILTLARAGFTAQQIAALGSVNNQPSSVVGAQQEATPQTLPNTGANPSIDSISQQLGVLTAAMQAGNLMNASQPTQMTADDVLAEIINPPDVVKMMGGNGNE